MRFSLIASSPLLFAVFSIYMVSEAYAEDTEQDLGEYKIINLANVPHLQDKEGFFVFPAFCPTACSVSWVKSEAPVEPQAPIIGNATTSANSTDDNNSTTLLNNAAAYAPQGEDESFNEEYLIGAIKVEFTKAGVYSFSYFIKPILGDFQDLAALQVITLPAEEGDKGYVPLSQVRA